MFSIDGSQWPYPCSIQRESEVTPSEISGMLLDKTYFNDVIGTYMKYTVAVVVPPSDMAAYNTLYEALTDPVDGHVFILPYNNSTVTVTGRVESVGDTYVRLPDNGKYWRGLRFTVVANHPSKVMTAQQVQQRGRAAAPSVQQAAAGDTYVSSGSGWSQISSADNIAY